MGAVAIAMTIAIAGAQAQSPAAAPSAASAAASAATPPAAAPAVQPSTAASGESVPASAPDARAVISYLTDVINWYGHLASEAQLVSEPNETLFYADDRQTAGEVLRLAFDYGRAEAAFIAKINGNRAASGSAPPSGSGSELDKLTQTNAKLDTAAETLRARIKQLQAKLATTPAAKQGAIASEVQDAQNELDLNQARGEAMKALAQFESSSASPDQTGSLSSQIDELERSVVDETKKSPPLPAESAAASTTGKGIFGLATGLIALNNKLDALEQNRELAQALSVRAAGVRKSILAMISSVDARGNALAKGAASTDVAALKDRKAAFETLLDEHKLLSAAAIPLSKQIVLLGVYSNNVGRWSATVQQRRNRELRSLIIRLAVLGVSLMLIFLGGLAWRWITNRYVKDPRRRGQVMAARRLTIGLLVVIVVMINFSDEIGSAATVVGFAAAGIAVALQNVILSIAGYFFLIGRFGIRAGDRVQIGGVTGDVIEVGLVKLSLMELGGKGTHLQPTGRVVVFSNAIVFQPSGNFFKQAPGTSFVWNEVRLTLAPDVDYRLAEKRLLEAVDEVYARYRDRVIRDYRHLERDLNVILETPKPQSRLLLSETGLEIVIRYPAETYSAPQISDEISRRLLDAINRQPGLRLVAQATANIQTEVVPAAADNIDQTAEADGQQAEEKESAGAEEKLEAASRANK